MKNALVCIADIVVDFSIQPRENGLNQEHVEELAQAYRDGAEIPIPRVWQIGNTYKLSRGFHRIEALKRANVKKTTVEVMTGTEAECAIDAACSNQGHGLKRTNADKRRSVEMVLKNAPDWSDRRIAESVGVTNKTVGEVRSGLSRREEIPHVSSRKDTAGRLQPASKPAKKTSQGTAEITGPAKAPTAPHPKGSEPSHAEESDHESGKGTNEPVRILITEDDEREELERRKRPEAPKDAIGNVIPPELRDTFMDTELDETLGDLSMLLESLDARYQRILKSLSRKPYKFCHFAEALDKLAQIVHPKKGLLPLIIEHLEAGVPHAVCKCGGRNPTHVDCRMSGYLPKWRYDELNGAMVVGGK